MDAYIYMMLNGSSFFATSPGDTGELERRRRNSLTPAKDVLCLCCVVKIASNKFGEVYCSAKCEERYYKKKGWKYHPRKTKKKGGE
jgi:hypothetical protein